MLSYKLMTYQTFQLFSKTCHHWIPDSNSLIKGIVVIVHGMMEHGKRYEDFAQFLNKNNYVVMAHDQKGHGQTGLDHHDLGHLPGKTGWGSLISDLELVVSKAKSNYPNLPIYILGHSMGSYIAQYFAAQTKQKIDGLLLSGSSYEPPLSTLFGKFVSSLFRPDKKAHLLERLVFLGFNNDFKPQRTPYDWLSSNQSVVDAYLKDPLCGFVCSYGFYQSLFTGLYTLYKGNMIDDIPGSVPVFIFSGEKDPLGKNTKSVKQLMKKYQSKNRSDLQLHIFPDARHETLNETNRNGVFGKLLEWLNSRSQNIS